MILVATALLSLRNLPFLYGPIPNWSADDYLLARFVDLLYTSVAAAPVGWLLNRTRPWWRFPSAGRG